MEKIIFTQDLYVLSKLMKCCIWGRWYFHRDESIWMLIERL